MKIYDGVMVNDELDLLELRLMEIGDLVDHVVVCESDRTFRGDEKPLWFEQFAHRFGMWQDKIIHVKADNSTASGVPDWEWAQRRSIAKGFDGADMTDIIMISDVDEIPSRRALDRIRRQPPASPQVLSQYLYYYSVSWKQNCLWNGTIAMPRGLGKIDVQKIRDMRNAIPQIEHGGWHFSWFGNADDIRHKLQCHTVEDDLRRYPSDVIPPDPTDGEHIQTCIETGADLFRRKAEYARKDRVELDPGGLHPSVIERWLADHPKWKLEGAAK